MTAYYNEIDPFCAQWLRNLIGAGLIAKGEVDERSIVDVQPDDVRGFEQCHFFAGIGVWSHALRLAGVRDSARLWTGSCPCQGFSVAGLGKGFDDERHLWSEFFRLIEKCRPSIVFGEQVASRLALEWFDLVSDDLERTGYAVGAADLCAASVGAPHIRQRLYWVANTDEKRQVGVYPLLQRGEPLQDRAEAPGCGKVAGFWQDAHPFQGMDGKTRLIESDTFPVVDGNQTDMACSGAAGNAIVAPLAAEFIRVAVECIP